MGHFPRIQDLAAWPEPQNHVDRITLGGRQFNGHALAGVAQWAECQQGVTGSIAGQGTGLGCGPGPQYGVCERQPHTDISLPLFLPPFPSKDK